MKKLLILMILIIILVLTSACAARKVSRVSSDRQTDLSGEWNDTDSRLVAEEMIKDLTGRPWIADYTGENDKKPVIIVGSVRLKDALEHINTSTFIKDIERELINSGKVKFVASSDERGQIRQERKEQQTHASMETAKRLAAETGADFMLIGNIATLIDQWEGKKAKFYQVDMELINVESNEKVWIGSKEIKKLIGKKTHKW